MRNLSHMVKIFCTEAASKIVDRSIQVHGGLGLMKELPLGWWYRQLRSIRITEGTPELRWRMAQAYYSQSQMTQGGNIDLSLRQTRSLNFRV